MSFKQWSQALYSTRTLSPTELGGDPYWSNVIFLLRHNGSAFVDASDQGKSVTATGSVGLTTGPFAGTSAAVFDGNAGKYLTVSGSDFNFGVGDFTAEAWIYPESFSSIHTYISTYGGTGTWLLQHRGGGFVWGHGDNQPISERAYSTLNTWVHVAVTRSGSTLKMFYNGVQQGASATNSDNLSTTNPLLIGTLINNVQHARARLSEIRITKTVARYTENFTAPTQPFPDF